VLAVLCALIGGFFLVRSLGIGPGGSADVTPTYQSVTRQMTAEDGGIIELDGDGAIVVLPWALSQDTEVTVQTQDPAGVPGIVEQQPAFSPVYEVTTTAGAVDGEIELQLPYDDAELTSDEERNLSIYYLEGEQHVALVSMVDTENNVVYARATHLTSFWVRLNSLDDPKIVRAWSSPAKYGGMQPGRDVSDLTVSAEVQDDNLDAVWMRYYFCTFQTIGTSGFYRFVELAELAHRAEMIHSFELDSPPVHTDFVPDRYKGGGGRCVEVSDWTPVGRAPSGEYQSTFLMSRVNWGTQEVLKMELAEIKVDIIAVDLDEQTVDKSLIVPVSRGPLGSDIEHQSPGCGETIYTMHPDFSWGWDEPASVGAARFYLAKGGVLWPDQGRPHYEIQDREVDPFRPSVKWQAGDGDLKPGDLYCWGLKVSYDDTFGDPDDSLTEPCCFYVGEGDDRLDVTVRPSRGQQGEMFQVSVSGLEPGGTATAGLVRPGSTSREILYDDIVADGKGQARFSIGSSTDMRPGIYEVYVLSNDGPGRGEATFELTEVERATPTRTPRSTDAPTSTPRPTARPPTSTPRPTSKPTRLPTAKPPTSTPRPTSRPTRPPTATPVKVPVPNVVGLTKEQAEEKLKAAGFGVQPGPDGYSDEVATGHIYKQKPAAGELHVPSNTIVVIYRSRGAPTRTGSCSPPKLLSPADGQRFELSENIQLSWSYDCPLADNEHFDVRVWREGEAHKGVTWTKDAEYWLAHEAYGGGKYYWTVAVVRGKDGVYEGDVTAEAPARWLEWKGVQPTATPKPTATVGPVEVMVHNETGGEARAHLSGPAVYDFVFPPGDTPVEMLPGQYTYTVESDVCNPGSGTLTVPETGGPMYIRCN
jgi:hypothetical protein